MRQPTLDEAARIIDAGDAMAERLREQLASAQRSGGVNALWWDSIARLIDAWRDATRQVAP